MTGLGRDEPPLVRRKLSDQVLERLVALIASGEYAPGKALPSERELMAAFGVGRPAVREAMQALAHRGLITIKHGERARVRARDARSMLGPSSLVEIRMLGVAPELRSAVFQARASLERGLVREVVARITPAQTQVLADVLARQARLLDAPEQFVLADQEFHAGVVGVLQNPVLDALLEGLPSGLENEQLAASPRGAAVRKIVDANSDLLRALEARDPGGADRAAQAYFRAILASP